MPIPDQAAVQNPYGPLITFQSQNILPPSAIYVSPNDSILINLTSPSVVANVTLDYRLLKADGTLVATRQIITTPGSFPTGTNFFIPPTEGFILSLTLQGDNTSRGQVFARIFLALGGLQPNLTLAHCFCQGYLSQFDVLGFPQSPIESSLNGRGWLHDQLKNGAVGNPVSFVVPASVRWLMRSIFVNFQSSATVANRTLRVLVIDPATQATMDITAPAVITAGQSIFITFAPGLTINTAGQRWTAGFPSDLIVPAGWTIEVTADGFQAGDQITTAVLTVEEFVGL